MGKLRVISGDFRGRYLDGPSDPNTRPTSDKVKEALFNILAPRIAQATFLDLFAGSGAIGIEAISRGAKHLVFVEKNAKNVRLIQKNLSLFACSERATVFFGACEAFLKTNKTPFDIVYADPPYNDPAVFETILPTLERCDTLRPQGIVIVEHFHKRILHEKTLQTLLLLKRYRYGGTTLSSYVKNGCRLSGNV